MRLYILLFVLLYTRLLCAQKKTVDTLFMLGKAYPIEKTTPYYLATEDVPLLVTRSQHLGQNKMRTVQIYQKNSIKQDVIDEHGDVSTIEFSHSECKGTYTLYYYTDSLAISDELNCKLKSNGKYYQIDKAQVVLSDDTCSRTIYLQSTQTSMGVFGKLGSYISWFKPKYVIVATLYYTYNDKIVYYLPMQFRLTITKK